MTAHTDEICRWISDDRNHGVNINSVVLSDMCCEIIRARAKIEAAEKLAEAAWEHDEAFNILEDSYQIAARDKLEAALSVWESLK